MLDTRPCPLEPLKKLVIETLSNSEEQGNVGNFLTADSIVQVMVEVVTFLG